MKCVGQAVARPHGDNTADVYDIYEDGHTQYVQYAGYRSTDGTYRTLSGWPKPWPTHEATGKYSLQKFHEVTFTDGRAGWNSK